MVWKERLLEMDDLPVILEWYNDEELHNIADIKPFKRYTIEEFREYWTEKLSRSYASYHVIVVKDEVIGRVGLKKTKYDDTYVMEYSILIGVSNLYSKGLGTEITKYFINKSFLDPDIEAVLLQVREDNKRAIRCYEKAGLKKIKSYIENEVKVYEMIKVKKEETVSKKKSMCI
ncbi:GNAT family N-acetyltransferase [Bacillus cereus]|uniref:GNAT family N-acetyltransferase n=1 Tax=Bacillus cereus TaxID=1396 RepID=UPI001BB40043|nr:GNAT family N-acetyltransferase [Bacillus cereus]QUW24169.1 GNAT family N-acetyltransferase [Bacillus cereus]